MTKRITLALEGCDGNAFALLAAFNRQARREGWTPDDIQAVLSSAKSGDYDNLLRVLMEHCESPDDE